MHYYASIWGTGLGSGLLHDYADDLTNTQFGFRNDRSLHPIMLVLATDTCWGRSETPAETDIQ
jgi:hypothetical protein